MLNIIKDINDHVYSPLTNAQTNELQRLQKAVASLVLGKYVSSKDILKLGWLPVAERRVFDCMKLAYNAIHYENWPSINSVEIKTAASRLRNNDDLKLMSPMIKGTLQDQASKQFNRLPSTVRLARTLPSFCNSLRKVLLMQAKKGIAH